ncbi:MAG TPA: citrate/2-methylcitrate synthase, partial [Dehalococcoidia bacterium]|nr:citrate/2-methylcitrate synthase [Dehalococcoidia bacterium]
MPRRSVTAGRPDTAGTTVLESSISSIEDDVLRYRGYPVEQLAGAVPFEEVAWLLWTGEPGGTAARASVLDGLVA